MRGNSICSACGVNKLRRGRSYPQDERPGSRSEQSPGGRSDLPPANVAVPATGQAMLVPTGGGRRGAHCAPLRTGDSADGGDSAGQHAVHPQNDRLAQAVCLAVELAARAFLDALLVGPHNGLVVV